MLGFRKTRGRTATRAGLLAGAAAAILALSGVGASSAFAEVPEPTCEGADITGKGASLQKVAQGIWTGYSENAITQTWTTTGTGFDATCEGEVAVNYHSTGSGPGLEAWGVGTGEFKEPNEEYIASDDAPDATQLGEINEALEEEGGVGNGEPFVIPVTQTAIGIVAHLPEHCTVSQIPAHLLETVTGGTITTWNQLEEFGTKYYSEHEGKEGACDQQINRVVREEGSGTTFQFKHYLDTIAGGAMQMCVGGRTWAELQPVAPGGGPNIEWPEGCEGIPSVLEGKGGSGVVNKVNATASSIGYAALPDIEKNKSKAKDGTGNDTITVLEVENGIDEETEHPVFAPPNDGENNANCKQAEYDTPTKPGGGTDNTPTEAGGVTRDWSHVYGSGTTTPGAYPICTLTYVVAAENSAAVFGPAEATTIQEFLHHVVDTAGGQAEIAGNWYAPLPQEMQEIATHSVETITTE